MRPSRSLVLAVAAVLGTVALLGACNILPTVATSQLHSLLLAPPTVSQRCAVSFSVRDLRLAGYLDRAEIVTDRSDSRVQASSLNLWAAPIKDEARRTLGRAISERWTDSRLVAYPWRFGEMPALVLDIAIDQLEPVAGRLEVQARWQLLSLGAPGRENSRLVRNAVFRKSIDVTSADAGGTVAAINQALSLLSDDIAQSAASGTVMANLCGG